MIPEFIKTIVTFPLHPPTVLSSAGMLKPEMTQSHKHIRGKILFSACAALSQKTQLKASRDRPPTCFCKHALMLIKEGEKQKPLDFLRPGFST